MHMDGWWLDLLMIFSRSPGQSTENCHKGVLTGLPASFLLTRTQCHTACVTASEGMKRQEWMVWEEEQK